MQRAGAGARTLESKCVNAGLAMGAPQPQQQKSSKLRPIRGEGRGARGVCIALLEVVMLRAATAQRVSPRHVSLCDAKGG